LGGRLEGWQQAPPSKRPSFETRRNDAALLRMRSEFRIPSLGIVICQENHGCGAQKMQAHGLRRGTVASKPKYRSKVAEAVHQGVRGMHRLGLVDKKTMREFDVRCFTSAGRKRPDGKRGEGGAAARPCDE
jgi:hypothetical protein